MLSQIASSNEARTCGETDVISTAASANRAPLHIASIIVSHIAKENGSWDKALVEKLERFRHYQISPTVSDVIFNNPYIMSMWDFSHNINKIYKQTWDNIIP